MSGAIAALRAELISARDALDPQITGFYDLRRALSLSDEAQDELNDALRVHDARLRAVNGALEALDDLEATGYPNKLLDAVPRSVLDELNKHDAAIHAALAELYVPAAGAYITPGIPVDK